jgi:hypothetical protein
MEWVCDFTLLRTAYRAEERIRNSVARVVQAMAEEHVAVMDSTVGGLQEVSWH